MDKKKRSLAILAILLIAVVGGGYYFTQSSSSKTTTSGGSTQPTVYRVKRMDVKSIDKGDYSTAAGTWKNSDGDELTIDKSGLKTIKADGNTRKVKVYKKFTESNNTYESQIYKGALKTYVGNDTSNPSADDYSSTLPLTFVPANTGTTFPGSASSNRIQIGDGNDTSTLYYREGTNIPSYAKEKAPASDNSTKVNTVLKALKGHGFQRYMNKIDGEPVQDAMVKYGFQSVVNNSIKYFYFDENNNTVGIAGYAGYGGYQNWKYVVDDKAVTFYDNAGNEIMSQPYTLKNGHFSFDNIDVKITTHKCQYVTESYDGAQKIVKGASENQSSTTP